MGKGGRIVVKNSLSLYASDMNKKQRSSFESILTLLGGLVILTGLLVLATTNQWIGLSARDSWPISLLLPGIALFAVGLRVKANVLRALLIFFGIMHAFIGAFFFIFTLGVLQWSDMSKLWPVFILTLGLSFLATYWLSDRKTGKLLVPGIVLSGSALVTLLLLQLNSNLMNTRSVGPILVILIGIGLVIVPRLRKVS